MNVIEKLSHSLGTRDIKPNIELANAILKSADIEDIGTLVRLLDNDDLDLGFDCLNVLCEIGEVNPRLISDHLPKFIELLHSNNSRISRRAMTAIAGLVEIKHKDIFQNLDEIIQADNNSVGMSDRVILTLSNLATVDDTYSEKIFPMLLKCIHDCPPKGMINSVEKIMVAVNDDNKNDFLTAVKDRIPELSDSSQTRIQKLLNDLEA